MTLWRGYENGCHPESGTVTEARPSYTGGGGGRGRDWRQLMEAARHDKGGKDWIRLIETARHDKGRERLETVDGDSKA